MPERDEFRTTYQYGTLLVLPPPNVTAVVDELRGATTRLRPPSPAPTSR
jgi:hypothetical protein